VALDLGVDLATTEPARTHEAQAEPADQQDCVMRPPY